MFADLLAVVLAFPDIPPVEYDDSRVVTNTTIPVLVLPFLALGFLGVRGMQLRLEIVAFVGLLIATPWALYGRRAAASVLFPALYLIFCIPLATFLDVVTIHLRLFATGAADFLLQASGVDIVREGTMLAAVDGSFAIDVADPCGGLRSIFALMSFAVAYAYLGLETWRQRFLVVALSVPLAVGGDGCAQVMV